MDHITVFEATSTSMQHALEITMLVWECNGNPNYDKISVLNRNQTKYYL